MKTVGVVRDVNSNPTDWATFQDASSPSLDVQMCGTSEWLRQEIAHCPDKNLTFYERLDELLGYDLLEVADFMYPWSQYLAANHPNVIACIWENIPFNNWSPAGVQMLLDCKGFIARSVMAAAVLRLYGVAEDRIDYIPAAVDTEDFSPIPLPRHRRVLFAGRHCWEKGVYDLLFAAVRQDWDLAFAGSGTADEQLPEIAKSLGVNANFYGQIAHRDMPAFLRSGDVFVYPSLPRPEWIEQFGVSALEAMACGLPIVTTDCGAFLDFVPMPLEQCVPSGRFDMLRDAIDSALEHPERGQRNRAVAVERYSSQVVGAQLRKVYAKYL